MDLNRRDFHRLTMAALGGAVTGTLAGCGGETPVPATSTATTSTASTSNPMTGNTSPKDGPAAEWHLCRGLNACKGKGEGGKNDCAGTGACASLSVRHECGTQNACKGQGGCGEDAGANECRGKGSCHVPLMPDAWEKVRARFEETMKKDKKKFGEAPPAPKES